MSTLLPHLNDLFLFFIGTFVSLFSIVDPLMAAPLFVTLTANETAKERAQTAKRASIIVCCIMLTFFIAGSLILKFFGISIDALRIAGGLMILGSAYGMLEKKERLAPEEQKEAEEKVVEKEDIAFSPLAMPMLSGPGAIAVIMGLTTNAKTIWHYLAIILAIMFVAFLCYVTMLVSDFLMKRLGPTIMKAFTRIMGFILLCVGVQFIVNGIMPILTQAMKGAPLAGH